jgi:HAD superfamily hydrolase (TIGR01549 family)
MSRPRISLVIIDLDNTVYDWFTAFVRAFYAMVHEAAPLIGVDEEQLLNDLQAVHRKHGDSEHPFALLETRAVQRMFSQNSQQEITQFLDPAFHAFNRVRKQNLKLYEGVRETLEEFARFNVPVAAYTDARIINCLFRLNSLEIKKLISRLYAPSHVTKDLHDLLLSDNFVRLLAPSDRKPNPQTLIDICSQYGTAPSDAVYVGDSLVRDIYMARGAGLRSAWAKFGTLYDKTLWPKLVRVTHWTEADVQKEESLREKARGTEPDCVLYRFSDLLLYFEFTAAILA